MFYVPENNSYRFVCFNLDRQIIWYHLAIVCPVLMALLIHLPTKCFWSNLIHHVSPCITCHVICSVPCWDCIIFISPTSRRRTWFQTATCGWCTLYKLCTPDTFCIQTVRPYWSRVNNCLSTWQASIRNKAICLFEKDTHSPIATNWNLGYKKLCWNEP